MRPRCGSTLIEVILSMSAGSAVMLLAISLVHQTMVATKASRNRSDDQHSLDQLAYAFRCDVHLAKHANQDSDTVMQLIYFDGTTITYTASENSVTRERMQVSEATEHQKFVFSKDSNLAVRFDSDSIRAALEVRSPTGLIDRPSKLELSVDASLRRWSALEQKGAVSP